MRHRFRHHLLLIPSITLYLGFFIAAAITYVMPKQYESFAVVEIKLRPEAPDIATERLRFTNPDILEKVSQELDLPTRWRTTPETSARLLQKAIRTDQIRGTDLLRIRARHTNPEDAMDIIGALFNAYSEERKAKWEQSDEQRQRRELRDAVTKQGQVVDALHQKLQGQENNTSPNPTADLHQLEQRRLQELRLSLLDTLGGPDWHDMHFGIIIHDDPVMAEDPISPNAYFNLTLGAIAGLFLGIPLALGIIALLHRLRPPES